MSWSFQLIFFWMRSGFPHRTHTGLNSAPDHSSSLALLLSFSSRQICHQDTSFKQSLPLQNLICFNLLKKIISISITAVLGAWNDSEQKWFIKWLRNPGDCGYPHSEWGRERMNELKHALTRLHSTCCFWSVVQKCSFIWILEMRSIFIDQQAHAAASLHQVQVSTNTSLDSSL